MRSLCQDEVPQGNLEASVVESLIQMLDVCNPFVKQFRIARDRLQQNGDQEFKIRIVAPREGDPPQYSLPTTDQLAMLVVGDFTAETFQHDIIIETTSGALKQISALHPAFMALQYPLLFPYGERGYQVGVLYEGITDLDAGIRTKMTMQDYFCYMFHYRRAEPNPYLCYGTLSAQAKVDARACIDESRLWYILENQADIRMESIQGISDAVNRGCIRGNEMGKITVLPASFTGGRRYMLQNYYDRMAICREFGPPDFFVTFTCNPKWPEIVEGLLEPRQRGTDRADIIVRVFNMKLEDLLHDIKKGQVFGPCSAGTYTVLILSPKIHSHIYFPVPSASQTTSHLLSTL